MLYSAHASPLYSTLPCPAWEVNFVQMMDGTCFVCSHRDAYMASKELRMEAHCCSQQRKVGVPPSPSLRICTEKKNNKHGHEIKCGVMSSSSEIGRPWKTYTICGGQYRTGQNFQSWRESAAGQHIFIRCSFYFSDPVCLEFFSSSDNRFEPTCWSRRQVIWVIVRG